MSSEFLTACNAFAERLAQLVNQDQGLRECLNDLALKLVSATEKRESPRVNGQIHEHETKMALAVNGTTPEVNKVNECLPALTLGRSAPVITEGLAEKVHNRPGILKDQDLGEIEVHSRLKAEAMRWAATRQRLLRNGARHRGEIAQKDRELLERVKGRTDCYLWMLSPNFRAPEDLKSLEDVAKCFDLLADALGVIRKVLSDPEIEKEFLPSVLEVLAYAQSALRAAVGRVHDRADADQKIVYDWLRSTTDRKQIYLWRFMQLDDPADPSCLDEIRSILVRTDETIDGKRQAAKQRKACLQRLRYHAILIGDGRGTENDRRSIVEAVEEILRLGVPPSNVEIRQSLLPIIDQVSDGSDLPKGISLVLREIERFTNSDDSDQDRSPIPRDDEQTERAASLLEGKCVLIVGGDARPHAQDTIKSALRLKDLIWIGASEINSTTDLEPHVARSEVAVVLLAIRWSPHSFGELSRYCERHGKPLVRIPGGYNRRQLAAQILAQCGNRLARAKASEQPSLVAQTAQSDRS